MSILRTSLVIEPDLLNSIKAIAKKEKRSLSKQVNKIIEEWFNARKRT